MNGGGSHRDLSWSPGGREAFLRGKLSQDLRGVLEVTVGEGRASRGQANGSHRGWGGCRVPVWPPLQREPWLP